MADNTNDMLKESTSIIEEVEKQLEKLLTKKKEDIEKALLEKISQEKEEAKKRTEQIEREFEREKEALEDYRKTIADIETEKANLQNQIKEHFNQALHYQKLIEKMAGMTVEELGRVSALNQKLDELRQRAEEKLTFLRKDLEEKFGIIAEVPESFESEEISVDLEHELVKLKKIKELLAADGPGLDVQKELEKIREEAGASAAAPSEAEIPIPEVPEIIESAVRSGAPQGAEEGPEEGVPAEQPESEKEEESFETVFETLEKYRKTDTTHNNGEINFFQKDQLQILDGEFLISAMSKTLEEAKRLYLRLRQTESPKDQFFVKQEILNQQEILRKVFLRTVKICEKENCSLPGFTAEILNVQVLREILERLSMGNWSNLDDFSAFDNYISTLKNSYYAKITPPLAYLKSILKELES
jgi:hypothetical protein